MNIFNIIPSDLLLANSGVRLVHRRESFKQTNNANTDFLLHRSQAMEDMEEERELARRKKEDKGGKEESGEYTE